jgi:hypothetical protein
MNKSITYKDISEAYRTKGYRFFTGAMDINLFGIRSSVPWAGQFDDLIGVAFTDLEGIHRVYLWDGTTDPSDQWLKTPMHKDGTLILLEGQYRGALKLGVHGRTWASGGYKAFEQVEPMKYVRDNNKDNILDIEGNAVIEGVFKTNIHRAHKYKIVDRIGSYSAGCQVIQSPEDFVKAVKIGEEQVKRLGINSFTYTLFNEKDFV